MAETSERIFTAADVTARRDGDWIIVTLAREVIHRRLTRDRAFTYAWVVFAGNRSPDYPKTREHFSHVELRGDWRIPSNRNHWLRSRIEVPIIENQGDK